MLIAFVLSVMQITKFSIGATAAIITSMGLIAGLTQGADARVGIIAGLLIVALADNVSDSFSIHIYRESEGASAKEVALSTFGNFAVRLCVVLTFVVIVLCLPPYAALVLSSLWGLFLLALLSYLIAKSRKLDPFRSMIWHLVIAVAVIVGSKYLGNVLQRW